MVTLGGLGLLAHRSCGGGAGAERGEAGANADPQSQTIDTWIWQLDPELAADTAPFYRDMLSVLPADARVLVFAPNESAVGAFQQLVPVARGDARIKYDVLGLPVGAWARDFYTPFDRAGEAQVYPFPAAALLPRERGTARIPRRLRSRGWRLKVLSGEDALVGGDLLLTGRHVLIGEHTVQRVGGGSPEALAAMRARVERTFGRELIIVGEGRGTPYFHLDMFLTPLNDTTLLLGDPQLSLRALKGKWSDDGRLAVSGVGTFEKSTQQKRLAVYARIASQLKQAGFQLQRIPILHGEPPSRPDRPEVVLNWNNAVTEVRAGRKIAYIPRCGQRILDRLAASTWRGLGYEVRVVDCRKTILSGGAVHCLTNEIRRVTGLDDRP